MQNKSSDNRMIAVYRISAAGKILIISFVFRIKNIINGIIKPGRKKSDLFDPPPQYD